MRKPLTIDAAAAMDMMELVTLCDSMIADYAPAEEETEEQERERLGRTLDEVPELYRWFLTCQSYFEHWSDAYADQYGSRSWEYKRMKQRREAMERMSKAAKLRYEGASRKITIIQDFSARMSHNRKEPSQ